MEKLHASNKTCQLHESHQLKESDSDQVTYKKSNGEIIGWEVYSHICNSWFEIPLDVIEATFPNKLIMAQQEIDEMRSLELDHLDAKADERIDADRDDSIQEGA